MAQSQVFPGLIEQRLVVRTNAPEALQPDCCFLQFGDEALFDDRGERFGRQCAALELFHGGVVGAGRPAPRAPSAFRFLA